MGTLVIQIICGNVLIGTLFVGLFTLRHMVKLKRAIDDTCATVNEEPANEKKSEFIWEYQPHYNAGGAGGGGGGGGGAGGAGGCPKYYFLHDGRLESQPKGE